MNRDRGWYARQAIAVLFVAAFAAPTLLYPFGRDQALYHYVATGWLDGFLPYRDSFDHKPPVLYLVYGLAALLSGREMWGIRLLEILAIPALAAGLARALRQLGARVELGPIAVLIAGFYFTVLDYWHTAQAELWVVLFLAWTWALVEGARRPRDGVLAGALAAAAFLVKFPAALLGLGLLVRLAWRLRADRPEAVRGLAGFLAGGVGVVGVVFLPFALSGTLGAAWDVLVPFNLAHAASHPVRTWPLPVFLGRWAPVYALTLLPALGLGLVRSWREPAVRTQGMVLLLCLGLSVASVYLQQKLFPYHWGAVIPFLAVGGVWGLSTVPRLDGWPTLGLSVLVVGAGLVWAPPWHHNAAWSYPQHVQATARMLTGRLGRAQYVSVFVSAHSLKSRYDFRAVSELAGVVNVRKRPGDALCARGYEPTLYALTDLRCPSRFASDFPVRDKGLKYRRETWATEHREALHAHPPTFVLVTAHLEADRAELEAEGYERLLERGRYQLYARSESK